MFNIYNAIDIEFNNGEESSTYRYLCDISDFDDYFIIRTEVIFGTINRGWRGDMTFKFYGFNLEKSAKTQEEVELKDVLCINRKFEKNEDSNIVWEYKFSKY